MNKLTRLFQPIKIAAMVAKNRIVMPCINHSYSLDGTVNERLIEYYKERAKGGVGTITIGGCAVHELGRSFQVICIYDDKFNRGLTKLTDSVHVYGAKIIAQLYHAGGYAKSKEIGGQPLAPSAVPSKYTKETPRAMSRQDILEVQDYFVQAAVRAKKVGFDGVELIGSAGYLIAEFLSPYTNLRTDEYGGSFDNRCRFVLELVNKIKLAVGRDYPLIVRLSGSDFIKFGNTNEQAILVAQALEAAGVDAINVTGGWHESKIPQTSGDLPTGGFGYLAANIKNSIRIPVIASNRINDPLQAEKMLAMGMADMINMGRPLLADPQLPNKAQSNQLAEIRKCIACGQGCFDRRFAGKDVLCMINYYAGREYLLKPDCAKSKKKILVIGGGVAGMEFAINATLRGHSITIWEKEARLGGQVYLAAKPIGKQEFEHLVTYQTAMISKLNINVCLNQTATYENISNFDADIIVIATGSHAVNAPFKISDRANIVQAREVLAGEYIAGKNIVIVGGGAVGCETAILLADEGTLSAQQTKFALLHRAETPENILQLLTRSSRTVNIVEMGSSVAKDVGISTKWIVRKHIEQLGIHCLTECKVIEITESGVLVESIDGNKKELLADTVILAMGARPNNELYIKLTQDNKREVYNIGDSRQPAKIFDCINAAVELANNI